VSPATFGTYKMADDRVATGIKGLDELIGKGFWVGSTTLLAGPTGAGKTMLGLQFLRHGATTGEPALYVGCGISGAIQHRVGMQTAENVLAINKDPDAPIGEFADLFVVGDLFTIVPKLTAEIRRRKGL